MTDKLALEFRTKGAALARAKTDGFAGLYFGLSTTLGTRIRCEVNTKDDLCFRYKSNITITSISDLKEFVSSIEL
jgi:hypothetical protein